MKNSTLFLVLLVAFSAILIAGCTQTQPAVTPASAPAVTAVPTSPLAQNQGGVAIMINQSAVKTNQTVAAPANQTAAANKTVAAPANQTVAVKTNQTAANVTDKK
jgi:hypothetical protein